MTELSHRTKRRIILGIGVFFVLIALGSFVLTFAVLGGERAQLDSLTALSPDQVSDLQEGQTILLTSTISQENPQLVDDLVVACEQNQDSDSGTWQERRQVHGPLVLDLDGLEIIATLRMPCPRGEYAIIDNPNDSMRRWVGLRRGDVLTLMGTVTGTSPLTLDAESSFGGDVEAYHHYLTKTRWYVLPFSAICLLAGVAFVVSALRSRAERTGAANA